MARLSIVLAALVAATAPLFGCGGAPPRVARRVARVESTGNGPATCVRGRSIIVVRHAEKAGPEKDTPLSERGQARARTLATMLGNAGATRLVGSQYRRTQETLAPLASRLGLRIDVRPADDVDGLIADLRAGADGSVTVVASHSNVVPKLIRELGGGARLRAVDGDSLAEPDFSRVVVIAQPCPPAPPIVVELSSGDP